MIHTYFLKLLPAALVDLCATRISRVSHMDVSYGRVHMANDDDRCARPIKKNVSGRCVAGPVAG